MKLETKNLYLREYLEQDWERVHIYGRDPEVSKYDVWGPNSEDDTKNFIKVCLEKNSRDPRMDYEFAVALKSSNLLIGGARISRDFPGASSGNIGYVINPEFQRKGFATELAGELLRFGIESLKLKLIWATCDVANVPSVRVLEKSGMSKVGVWEKHKMLKGHMRDSLRFEYAPTSYPFSVGARDLSENDRLVLQKLEESLWQSDSRFDLAYQEQIFAPDFFEFGRSGRVYNRKEAIHATSQEIVAKIPLINFKIHPIDIDTVLVTYISEVQYESVERANRSSIWFRGPNGWQLRFHQGTPT